MLKWYAELYKFSGKELTLKALRRVKILMILSLPAYPLAATSKLGQFSDNVNLLLNITFVLSAICLMGCAITKFVNRFWSRDKYLDEWERARKHESMAFTFQLMMYMIALFMLLGILIDKLNLDATFVFPALTVYNIVVILGGIIAFGYYVMNAYLLFTIKPIIEDKVSSKATI